MRELLPQRDELRPTLINPSRTFTQAVMKTPLQMYVIRTIVGLFETGHYSAIVYICGAWYQKGELSKRLAIINCATAIGPMFSGYLQAAAYNGLNGVHGMAGWQWVCLIDSNRLYFS